jgi:hypothetical protein
LELKEGSRLGIFSPELEFTAPTATVSAFG